MVTASFNYEEQNPAYGLLRLPYLKKFNPKFPLASVLLSGLAVFFHILLDRISQRVGNRQTADCANKQSGDSQYYDRECVLFGFLGISYGVSLHVILLD
jgi:hypothetical protein